MKTAIVAAAMILFGATAYAQTTPCNPQAAEKRLAGAALNSFMKKCQSDAQKSCEADSKFKRLAGAARSQLEGFKAVTAISDEMLT